MGCLLKGGDETPPSEREGGDRVVTGLEHWSGYGGCSMADSSCSCR